MTVSILCGNLLLDGLWLDRGLIALVILDSPFMYQLGWIGPVSLIYTPQLRVPGIL